MTLQRATRLRTWILTAVLAAAFPALPANAAVRAWVDNDRIAPAETVQFTIHRDGQTQGGPDLTPLRQDFDVLSTRSSTSIQIVNGSTSEGTEIIATLSPKHDGRITIPSISWGGERSQPVAVTVDPQAGSGNNAGARTASTPNVFLEATVDNKQPYVQGEVLVTVKLFTAQQLYHPSLDLPAGSDTLVQQVGSDEHSQVERNGRTYSVVARHYAIFPQRSGHMRLTAPVLQAEIADRANSAGNDPFSSFFGNSPFGSMRTQHKPILVHGEAIDLDVKPRPANMAANYWMPARDIQLSSDWRPQPLQVRSGDPATLELHLRAVGLTAEQLPDLTRLLDLPAGLKEYPDEAKLSNAAQGTDVVGSRDQSIALIADQSGHFTIPPLTLQWWDTQKNEVRTVRLPSRTIEVLPATSAVSATSQASTATTHAQATAAAAGEAQSNAQPGPKQRSPLPVSATTSGGSGPNTATREELVWRLLTIASFALWVVTIATWLLRRRRTERKPKAGTRKPAPASNANEARAKFHHACRANDARAARRHLLDWLAAGHPEKRQLGLHALARQTGDGTLSTLLRDLDRACYVGGDWSGAALAAALDKLPASLQPAPDPNQSRGLAPLYP